MGKYPFVTAAALCLAVAVGAPTLPIQSVTAAETTTATPAPAAALLPITSTQKVDRIVRIRNARPNDGLFVGGPYLSTATSQQPAAGAQALNGQYAHEIAVASNRLATWAQIETTGGKTYWVDQRLVVPANLEPIVSQQAATQTMVVAGAKWNDGLFVGGPYMTSLKSTTVAAPATTLNGQQVTVQTIATTKRGSWAAVRTQNGQVYWLDRRLLTSLLPITSSTTEGYVARVTGATRTDGLFTGGPYKSTATSLTISGNAQSLSNQLVQVTATQTNALGKWAAIKTQSGRTYWVDSRVLTRVTLDPIKRQVAASGTAAVSGAKRTDGLFTGGPYMTSFAATTVSGAASTLEGQTVAILQQAVTRRGQWTQIRTASGATYWVDARILLTSLPITKTTTENKTMRIDQAGRNDGLFTGGPYRSTPTSMRVAAMAKGIDGMNVRVLGTATNALAVWAKIQLADGRIFWIDQRALKSPLAFDSITARATVTYTGRISAGRTDGLFADGPYMTSSRTTKPSAAANAHNGEFAWVTETATTRKATWVKVQLENGTRYWLDARALTTPKTGWYSVNGQIHRYDQRARKFTTTYALPYYSQLDPRWRNQVYGGHTFGATGCGMASVAMIVSGFGQSVTPIAAANYAHRYLSFDTPGEVGSAQSDLTGVAGHWGINWHVATSQADLANHLKKGYPATVCLNLSGGVRHIVVLTGYQNGTTTVTDPYNGMLFSGQQSLTKIWNMLSWKADNKNMGPTAAVVYLGY